MEKAYLPTEKAFEPDEEARQPLLQNLTMSPPMERNNLRKHKITFADFTDVTETSASQKSNSYKEVLSQPAPGLSHRQRLLWIQKRRAPGLWVQCDDCDRWRFLPTVLDSHELPNKWFCRMHPDENIADCSSSEAPIRVRDEEDLIHSEYSAGSVVWARMPGWPWWPAMVDDCPDTEQFYWLDGFSDIPTHYNVVFFDAFEVTRAWIAPEQLKSYAPNKNMFKHSLKDNKYKKRLEVAVIQANDADNLTLPNRLAKYSFISRYKGNIVSPKKVNKRDLNKYHNQLKRKYNIEFPIEESESDEDYEMPLKHKGIKKRNVIIIGTPKKNIVERRNITKKTAKEDTTIISEIHDSVTNIFTVSENKDDRTDINVYKQPDSMAVQIGNTLESTANFDNDSSKTYIPESEAEKTATQALDFQIRIATPSSDDFDF